MHGVIITRTRHQFRRFQVDRWRDVMAGCFPCNAISNHPSKTSCLQASWEVDKGPEPLPVDESANLTGVLEMAAPIIAVKNPQLSPPELQQDRTYDAWFWPLSPCDFVVAYKMLATENAMSTKAWTLPRTYFISNPMANAKFHLTYKQASCLYEMASTER